MLFSSNSIVTVFNQAGLPDGVLNVVTGFGETAGAAVSSHMDIDKVRLFCYSCSMKFE